MTGKGRGKTKGGSTPSHIVLYQENIILLAENEFMRQQQQGPLPGIIRNNAKIILTIQVLKSSQATLSAPRRDYCFQQTNRAFVLNSTIISN